MTTEIIILIIYSAVSLLLGGIAATFEIWSRPTPLERANGRGVFATPKFNALGAGLFVAVLWPILLIGGLL